MIFSGLKRLVVSNVHEWRASIIHWTKPLACSLPLGTLADLGPSKSELIAENALLRVPLIMLKRQVKRPVCTKADRILLVLLARVVRAWKHALIIVQEDDRVAASIVKYFASIGSTSQRRVITTQAQGSRGNHRIDQGDGDEEAPSAVPNGCVGNG